MSPIGGCPACARLVEMRNMSCKLRRGYMNDEGTFIPGLLVRKGLVLSKEDYEEHFPCNACSTTPERCSFRSRKVESVSGMRDYDFSSDDDGHTSERAQWPWKEFFVPAKDVSEAVLKQYTRVNGGSVAKVVSGKEFKGQKGYLVRSRVRYTASMIDEIRKLSTPEYSDRLTNNDCKTRVRQPKKGTRVTEFTRFLRSSPSLTRPRETDRPELYSVRQRQPSSDRVSSSMETTASRGQLFPRTGHNRHDEFPTSSSAGTRGGRDDRRSDDNSSRQSGPDRESTWGRHGRTSSYTSGGMSYESKHTRHTTGEDDRGTRHQAVIPASPPRDSHRYNTPFAAALVAQSGSQFGSFPRPDPQTLRHLNADDDDDDDDKGRQQRPRPPTSTVRHLDEKKNIPTRRKESPGHKGNVSKRPPEAQQQRGGHIENRPQESQASARRRPRRYHDDDDDDDDDDEDEDEDDKNEGRGMFAKFSTDRKRHM